VFLKQLSVLLVRSDFGTIEITIVFLWGLVFEHPKNLLLRNGECLVCLAIKLGSVHRVRRRLQYEPLAHPFSAIKAGLLSWFVASFRRYTEARDTSCGPSDARGRAG
jgi:hypothetical protein